MICSTCSALNRDKARFCKKCGVSLSNLPLPGLVGLQQIRDELQALRDMTEGRRRAGRDPRVPYTTLILGKSGTAKSRLGGLITAELAQLKWITKAVPEVIDALQPDALNSKNIESRFAAAKGGVLFIDNAHILITEKGEPNPALSQLMRQIAAEPLDPVVLMAGLPFGLHEFLQQPKYNNLSSRFRNVFKIDDYTPAQLVEIARNHLAAEGFTVPEDTQVRLALRMRWLHRQTRMPTNDRPDLNGRMAEKEAMEIADEYYRRHGKDHVISPDDIKGDIDVRKSIDEVLKELNGLIGMDTIKQEVRELYAQISNTRKLQESGVRPAEHLPAARHCTITGNPGTGKTTVARVLGEIYEALGILPSGHVVEVDRSGLVAGFQGQTAINVNAVCDKAMGGVLFIDEAYAIVQDDQDSFGKEAINTLVKRLEDDRGKYMAVLAGYPKDIEDLLATNEGLRSRFGKHFKLDDYKPTELTAIFEAMARKAGYSLSDAARDKALDYFADRCARKTRSFGNGRVARDLWEQEVIRAQTKRVSAADASAVADFFSTVDADDIPAVSTGGGEQLDKAMAELNSLTGLHGVKTAVARLRATLEMQRLLGNQESLGRHYIFTGNPGTGKTTVARILARVFHGLGMLPTAHLEEVDSSKLIASYIGQTAPLVQKACDRAMGGVLFIDEAYALVSSEFGKDAISTLLKRMEDDRGKFVVIVAGYVREMDEFLASNSGLTSRFSDPIHFEDYSAAEMLIIFKTMAASKDKALGEGFEAALQARIDHVLATRDKSFANARTIRQLFDKVCESGANRAMQASDDDARRAAGRLLTVSDLEPQAMSSATA